MNVNIFFLLRVTTNTTKKMSSEITTCLSTLSGNCEDNSYASTTKFRGAGLGGRYSQRVVPSYSALEESTDRIRTVESVSVSSNTKLPNGGSSENESPSE